MRSNQLRLIWFTIKIKYIPLHVYTQIQLDFSVKCCCCYYLCFFFIWMFCCQLDSFVLFSLGYVIEFQLFLDFFYTKSTLHTDLCLHNSMGKNVYSFTCYERLRKFFFKIWFLSCETNFISTACVWVCICVFFCLPFPYRT